ncbi:hypothetical protein T10_10704, partial [Trichinella papuae]
LLFERFGAVDARPSAATGAQVESTVGHGQRHRPRPSGPHRRLFAVGRQTADRVAEAGTEFHQQAGAGQRVKPASVAGQRPHRTVDGRVDPAHAVQVCELVSLVPVAAAAGASRARVQGALLQRQQIFRQPLERTVRPELTGPQQKVGGVEHRCRGAACHGQRQQTVGRRVGQRSVGVEQQRRCAEQGEQAVERRLRFGHLVGQTAGLELAQQIVQAGQRFGADVRAVRSGQLDQQVAQAVDADHLH